MSSCVQPDGARLVEPDGGKGARTVQPDGRSALQAKAAFGPVTAHELVKTLREPRRK